MAKKFHKKAKEIRKLQAQHTAAPISHMETPRAEHKSSNFSDVIAHNTHEQVRRDLAVLGIVIVVMFGVLLVVNWAVHNTSLSSLITG